MCNSNGLFLLLDMDSESDSESVATLYCTETVPIAWTWTQFLIQMQISNHYCTVFLVWICVPRSGYESMSGNVNKP